jgi:cell wall-associated NlpC family hydrolase
VSRRLPILLAICALAVLATACGRAPETEDDPQVATDVVLTPEDAREGRLALAEQRARERNAGTPEGAGETAPRPRVVDLQGAGSAPAGDPEADGPSPGAPTDAEVRAELRAARVALRSFKRHLTTTAFLQTGPRARVLPDGTAVAPENAPEVVKRVILAANEIARFPYKWGGGHGAWRDDGYDCSGSVSFALAGAGLLDSPLTSGGFLGFGAEGPGEWITIYTNHGHIFMIVAGLRFDTSGRGRAGTRWQEEPRSTEGFAVRHIPGL